MKIANIDWEILHIFWTTWGNSLKFSVKMWLIIILKVTKNQRFTLSLEDAFFEKTQGGIKLTPSPPAVLELNKIDEPIWSLENNRKPNVFWCFQGL